MQRTVFMEILNTRGLNDFPDSVTVPAFHLLSGLCGTSPALDSDSRSQELPISWPPPFPAALFVPTHPAPEASVRRVRRADPCECAVLISMAKKQLLNKTCQPPKAREQWAVPFSL